MIVYRSLFRVCNKIPISKVLLRNRFHFCMSPNPNEQRLAELTSQNHLTQFQNLINQNTEESLQKAAEMLAVLQLEVQQNQQKIKQYENMMEVCPAHIKSLIEKLQIVKDNITQQQEQIQAIEKRAEKEVADCKNFAVSTIARQVLEVADSLARCKKISIEHHQREDHEVVVSIENADKQIRAIFERYGIQQFDPINQEYDPNKQQALVMTATTDQKLKNKVAHTMRTGYTIKGRLLRSAHVAVYQ